MKSILKPWNKHVYGMIASFVIIASLIYVNRESRLRGIVLETNRSLAAANRTLSEKIAKSDEQIGDGAAALKKSLEALDELSCRDAEGGRVIVGGLSACMAEGKPGLRSCYPSGQIHLVAKWTACLSGMKEIEARRHIRRFWKDVVLSERASRTRGEPRATALLSDPPPP